jgi:2-polyprenyl-6-methoxyphenol hydroxylase-like FAD-dependent oxidoreductase
VDTEVDVLIIGGGPAGLAAGIVCGRRGLHTMLCEKRSLPANKACGEGVMPTGVAYLEGLGVTQHLQLEHYFPFEGIRYFSPMGKIASAAFREGAGWGIPRLELSRALLQSAAEVDCLEMRTEVLATPIRVEGQGEHKRLWVKVGEELIGTRLLVGADGLNSGVRRWAGLQGPKGVYRRWGARQHFRIAPWSREVEVHWSNGLEAYITPCGENLVGVAFLWDRKRHPALPGGDKLIPTLLEAFPVLAERLQNACASDAALAVGPLQQNAIRPVADGVLLIGDAAGYLDALTGEGISLALAQALTLEGTVVPILQGRHGMPSRRDLSAYEQAYRAIVRPYYQITRFVLWLSNHPTLLEQVIRLLGYRPALFQSLLSANMGLIPLWRVVGKSIKVH